MLGQKPMIKAESPSLKSLPFKSVSLLPNKEIQCFLPERVHEIMVLVKRILRSEQSPACSQRHRLPDPTVQALNLSNLTHAIDHKREAVQRSQDQSLEMALGESIVQGES